MKILVMTGSPHKDGTSALLADKFIEGAKEAGHEIYRFDAGFKNIHTGKIDEVMLIKNQADLDAFKKMYGIDGEIEKEY